MTKGFYFLSIITFFCLEIHAQYKIRGVVSDEKNDALPFVSIYEKGTTNNTISNENGQYIFETTPGKHIIVFQYLGYKTVFKEVNINENTELNVALNPEDLNMDEVVIQAGEDPSYPIMRAAIRNREINKFGKQEFKAELYTKALMKIKDAPKTLFGMDLGNMDGILDSNRNGILYLSESISDVNFSPPGDYKEILLSSKVSGESNGISVNQFSYANFNFYNENVNLFRSLISPLADEAFSYYNFYLYEKFVDNNGKTVNKIKVKPKSNFRPCFTGFLYINEDLWNINSLDLAIHGDAIKNPIMDSIIIKQVFVPVKESNQWYLINQNVYFKANIFGFKADGNFNYIFKNYNFKPQFKNDFFGSEVFKVSDDAIKNDSLFWNANRPTPLTQEENQDYIRKDKIEKLTSSPAYKDSVDRVNNKFKVFDFIMGYDASNSFKKHYYGITSPLSNVSFNAVEGTNLDIQPYFFLTNVDGNKKFDARGSIKYGFADHQFKFNLSNKWNYNIKNNSYINIDFGRDYLQFFEKGMISTFGNMTSSLLRKDNSAKFFDKRFTRIRWGTEIVNSFSIALGAEYANRRSLMNVSNFSYRKKEQFYQINSPLVSGEPLIFNDNIFALNLDLRWVPGQKYQTFPNYKIRLNGKAPSINLAITKTIAIDNNHTDFLRVKMSIVDNYFPMKIFGYMKYRIEGGTFIQDDRSAFVDQFHFRSNNSLAIFASPYLENFKLIDGYLLSNKEYGALWLEHHFDGYVFDKIPILNKLGITGIINYSALINKEITYMEPGFGIEGIRIGAIDIMRLDYFVGIKNGEVSAKGFKIGLSAFIENIFGGR